MAYSGHSARALRGEICRNVSADSWPEADGQARQLTAKSGRSQVAANGPKTDGYVALSRPHLWPGADYKTGVDSGRAHALTDTAGE